jgi:hypothetical protein
MLSIPSPASPDTETLILLRWGSIRNSHTLLLPNYFYFRFFGLRFKRPAVFSSERGFTTSPLASTETVPLLPKAHAVTS